MIQAADVKAIALWQALSPAGRRRAAAAAEVRRYARQGVLFRQDELAQYLWILRTGWLHLVSSAVGQAPSTGTVVATLMPEDGLCGLSVLTGGRYSVSAVAATACEVVRVPAVVARALLQREPRFAYAALGLCAERLRRMAEQYAAIAHPVPQRVAATLLRLHQQFGSPLPLTHRELAQMACTTTESAIRVVRKLKAQGCVAGARGQLHIVAPAALERLLQPAANGHPANGHLMEAAR